MNTYYKFHNQKDRVRNLQCFYFMGVHKQRSGVKRYDVKGESDMMPTPTPPPLASQSATLPTLEKTRQLHNLLLRKEMNSKKISPDCHEKY